MKQEIKDEINNIGRGYGVEYDDAETLDQTIKNYWDEGEGADLVDYVKRLKRISKANEDWDEVKLAINELFDELLRLKDFYESETLRQANDKERMWETLKK